MIAKILGNSESFSGIEYSEKKCKSGDADFVEAYNFGYLDLLKIKSVANCVAYFEQWREKNRRVKNAQFHVSISCRGREASKEKLVSIGKQWLDKMGYSGLPTMIYFHTDTKNNHIHIITTRIGIDGKKINDSNERYRGRVAINEIMRNDIRYQCRLDFVKALQYKYSNLNQFECILNSMGYEVENTGDMLHISREKILLLSKESNIVNWVGERNRLKSEVNEERKKQLKAIFYKYGNIPMKQFEDLLRSKFGINLIFFGDKKSPYGYIVVDHSNKSVFKGGEIMNLKKLLEATNPSKNEEIHNTVVAVFNSSKTTSTKELNEYLKKIGVFVKKGEVFSKRGKQLLFKLPIDMVEKLKYNDKVEYINKFNPDSGSAQILSRIYDVDIRHITNISEPENKTDITFYNEVVSNAFASNSTKDYLKEYGISFYKHNDKMYLFDPENKKILDFDDLSLNHGAFVHLKSFHENEHISDRVDSLISLLEVRPEYSGSGSGVNNELPKKKRK